MPIEVGYLPPIRERIAVDDGPAKANEELDHYLEGYYMQPAEPIRQRRYCFAAWMNERVEAGATHLAMGCTGSDDARQVELREELSV